MPPPSPIPTLAASCRNPFLLGLSPAKPMSSVFTPYLGSFLNLYTALREMTCACCHHHIYISQDLSLLVYAPAMACFRFVCNCCKGTVIHQPCLSTHGRPHRSTFKARSLVSICMVYIDPYHMGEPHVCPHASPLRALFSSPVGYSRQ